MTWQNVIGRARRKDFTTRLVLRSSTPRDQHASKILFAFLFQFCFCNVKYDPILLSQTDFQTVKTQKLLQSRIVLNVFSHGHPQKRKEKLKLNIFVTEVKILVVTELLPSFHVFKVGHRLDHSYHLVTELKNLLLFGPSLHYCLPNYRKR